MSFFLHQKSGHTKALNLNEHVPPFPTLKMECWTTRPGDDRLDNKNFSPNQYKILYSAFEIQYLGNISTNSLIRFWKVFLVTLPFASLSKPKTLSFSEWALVENCCQVISSLYIFGYLNHYSAQIWTDWWTKTLNKI